MKKTIQGDDAYGQLKWDHYRGLPAQEIIEREDGWIGTSMGPAGYLEFFPSRLSQMEPKARKVFVSIEDPSPSSNVEKRLVRVSEGISRRNAAYPRRHQLARRAFHS